MSIDAFRVAEDSDKRTQFIKAAVCLKANVILADTSASYQ